MKNNCEVQVERVKCGTEGRGVPFCEEEWNHRPRLPILIYRIHCFDCFLHCQGTFHKHTTAWVFAMLYRLAGWGPLKVACTAWPFHTLLRPHMQYGLLAHGLLPHLWYTYKKPSESPLINLCGRKQTGSSLDTDLNCEGGSRGKTSGFSYNSLAFHTWYTGVLEDPQGVTSNPRTWAKRARLLVILLTCINLLSYLLIGSFFFFSSTMFSFPPLF